MDRKLNIDKILIFIAGFVSGILLSSFVSVSYILGVFILIIGICVLVAEKIRNAKIGKEVLFLSLVLISFSVGVFRYSISYHEPINPEFTGVVVSEPEQKENTTRFVFKSLNGEKALVSTNLYSSVEYGDAVALEGNFEKPGVITDDLSGRSFDYGKYLAKDDVYYVFNFAKVEILSSNHGNPVKHFLLKIKKSFVSKIKEILSEPYASLLSGLIISGKEAMPKDLLEEFRRAGIIHIVVLSGYNITIIAEFMRRMFHGLFSITKVTNVSKFAAGASIFSIFSFVLMTGAEATVVRAAIMVLVVIVAKMFGENYSASRALLLAAFLMLLENPKILVFDPSFQLSFLATLALIYIVPIFDKFFKSIPDKFALKTVVITTLSTQIAVLPYLIYSMGDLSLVSIFTNVFVLALIPFTMLVGFVATTLAYISVFLAMPISFIAHLLLSWILLVSGFFGNLAFASIAVPPIPSFVIILIYLCLVIFVWRLRNYSQHSPN